MPELRIDPLTGLRVIVAGERGEPARAPGSTCRPRPPIDPEADPFRRGPRGPHAAGGLRAAPTAARPTRRAGACGWCRTSTPRSAPGEPDAGRRPARRRARRARPVRRAPGAGAHEVVVNAPEPVASLPTSSPSRWRPRWASGASGCARTRQAAYVHVIVNEGREAGASLPHTHAQLYALPFVPGRGRARARALHRLLGPHPGPQPARPTWCRRRSAARAAGGGGRRGRGDLPVRLARALPRADRAAPAAAARFEDDGPLGAALLHDVAAAAGGGARRRCRRSTCGCARRRAAPSASAGGSTCCRAWRSPPGWRWAPGVHLCVLAPEDAAERLRDAERVASAPAVPPVERPIPLFAAEPPQEPLPYGRWAEALAERFDEPPRETRDRRRSCWFPDRTWGGRTYVPATAPPSGGFEVFGYVSYTREHEGAAGRRTSRAVADYTDETAEANPDWTLDLSDQEIGHWRGPEGRRGDDHAGLGRVAGGERRGGHDRARADHHRPVRAASRTASRSSRSTTTRATTSRCASTGAAAPSWRASRCTRTSERGLSWLRSPPR